MYDYIQSQLPVVLPVFFGTLWLAVTTLLGAISGWFSLVGRYPDRNEEPLEELRWMSGWMGPGVSMSGILKFDVCPSGLRVGIFRLFGPFARDFFVPWAEIKVERRDRFFWKTAELLFGNPTVGRISVAAHVGDRIARVAPESWPEPGPFLPEAPRTALLAVAKEWAFATVAAALFFTVGPRIITPNGPHPPIAVAILFPAITFGVASIFRYWNRVRR